MSEDTLFATIALTIGGVILGIGICICITVSAWHGDDVKGTVMRACVAAHEPAACERKARP